MVHELTGGAGEPEVAGGVEPVPAGDTDAIYRRVFQAIVDHKLLPGTQLKEDILCDIYGVGRTRIRKVLSRLAGDHIVDLVPNRGAFVASPSVDEAREVFRVRRLIEGHLVAEAANDPHTRVRAMLLAHLDRERAARESGDQLRTIRLCGNFHLLLGEVAHSPILGRFLRELVSRTSLIVAIYGVSQRGNCEMDEHSALAQAVIEGRAADAVAIMTDHLTGIENSLDLSDPDERQPDIRMALASLD